MPTGLAQRVGERLRTERHAYTDGAERPLGGYLGTMGVYGSVTGGLLLLARATGRRPPERVDWTDLALLALATHKASRLLSRDTVTSPLRAPFTRFREAAGEAEVNEEVRGDGVRLAVGQLVNCPFCLGQWVATGFGFGLLFAPRWTRWAATVLAGRAGADFLHLAYAAAGRLAEGPPPAGTPDWR